MTYLFSKRQWRCLFVYMRTGDRMRRDWRPLSSVETISVSLSVQWPYPSFWPPGSRALHDNQSCNGYCIHLKPSSSDSMEPNLTEAPYTSGICWCHTKERRCSAKLLWLLRWNSKTHLTTTRKPGDRVQRTQKSPRIEIPVCGIALWYDSQDVRAINCNEKWNFND